MARQKISIHEANRHRMIALTIGTAAGFATGTAFGIMLVRVFL